LNIGSMLTTPDNLRIPPNSKPWRLVTYIAFSDEKKAVAFEKYLKSHSGRAFANKRLR
jgi:hypothetical protein